MTFERIAFVWGENVSGDGPLTGSPSVSVALWPEVLGCASLRWAEGQMPDISGFDVFLVNLFHTPDSTHIAQIRKARPDAVIVAMPDPSLDLVLMHPEWMPMLEQMALADWIGGRTQYDCEVYGALLKTPSVWLPSPIGPTEWYEPFRELDKEDYIVALDHPMDPYASAHNVAALADIQRENGMRVLYASARDATKQYARLAGLEAEWFDWVPFADFVAMTARARLSVDLYARHSYHRHAVMCAMVGTPCVTSSWSGIELEHTTVESPFYSDDAVVTALNLLAYHNYVPESGWVLVEQEFGFEASRERVSRLVPELVP
jgi:hypothetical protein